MGDASKHTPLRCARTWARGTHRPEYHYQSAHSYSSPRTMPRRRAGLRQKCGRTAEAGECKFRKCLHSQKAHMVSWTQPIGTHDPEATFVLQNKILMKMPSESQRVACTCANAINRSHVLYALVHTAMAREVDNNLHDCTQQHRGERKESIKAGHHEGDSARSAKPLCQKYLLQLPPPLPRSGY